MIYKYSWENERGVIYEGNFRETDNLNIGDWFLSHQICFYCKVPILRQIVKKRVSYYFNEVPIYEYQASSGSYYQPNILHCSLYDQIVDDTYRNKI